MASQVESASGALRDPRDSQAFLAHRDLLDPLVTQGSSPKALLTFSARPSARQALQGPRGCQGSRDPPATKGSKEKLARTARRVTPAPLGLPASQALWDCRVLGAYEDCQGHSGPRGTGVPLDSEGHPGSQEPLGKWGTEARGAQRGSVAPRVTLADRVPKGSLEWPGPVESRAFQARTAGMACQDSMARRERPVAVVPQERRAPMGSRVSQDEQGPKARGESWAEPASSARLAPQESLGSPEMLACPGSTARLATGAQRELWAHRALLGLLASRAFRAGRAVWETPVCQARRASEVAWVTGALEEPQAPRETRASQVLMVFLGTKGTWVPVAL